MAIVEVSGLTKHFEINPGFLARVLPITSRSLLVLARVKNSALLSLSLADASR